MIISLSCKIKLDSARKNADILLIQTFVANVLAITAHVHVATSSRCDIF